MSDTEASGPAEQPLSAADEKTKAALKAEMHRLTQKIERLERHTPDPAALCAWVAGHDHLWFSEHLAFLRREYGNEWMMHADELTLWRVYAELLRERGEALRLRGTDLRLEMETYRDELGYDGVSDEVLLWADADENWREIAGEEGL
jgi:type IV secretory pathway VirB4 component